MQTEERDNIRSGKLTGWHIAKDERRNKKMLYQIKNSKAITLISLVIAIIVILILSGVTISFVLGKSGVVNMSNKGKDAYGEKQARREGRSCNG